jgi:glycosyltransferase involved in cell wall biosynthesis
LEKLLNRAQQEIPQAKIESTGFVPYSDVPKHLASASVGIIPYEESVGTHCAFAAKAVEYSALGIPVVSTKLKSVQSYFGDLPLLRFADFNGTDFAHKTVSWFDESPELIASLGKTASERVRTDLDWRAISRKAIDFLEKIYSKNVR